MINSTTIRTHFFHSWGWSWGLESGSWGRFKGPTCSHLNFDLNFTLLPDLEVPIHNSRPSWGSRLELRLELASSCACLKHPIKWFLFVRWGPPYAYCNAANSNYNFKWSWSTDLNTIPITDSHSQHFLPEESAFHIFIHWYRHRAMHLAQPMIHEILPKIPGSTQKLATVFNVVTIIWFWGTYTNSHHRCITELWSVLSILYVTKQTFKFCVPFVQYSIMAKSWRSNWPSHMASPLNSSHVQLSLLLWLGYGVVLYAALKASYSGWHRPYFDASLFLNHIHDG